MSASRPAVDRVVLPPARARTADVLAPPFLPAALRPLLARLPDAAALRVPVLVVAPRPLHLRLARALHAAAAQPGPCVVAGGASPRTGVRCPGTTLVLDVDALDARGVRRVAAALDDADAWIVATACAPPSSEPLATRLASLVLAVPPLAARRTELPFVADAVLAGLAARAARARATLAPDALAALAARDWPGDLPELEAVLAGALLASDGRRIEAAHLAGGVAPEPTHAPAAPMGAPLEPLVVELAHELMNPLSTVKAFAEHLPEMLEDRAKRDHFARLAEDAIARMDDVVENLLAFARLGEPRHDAVPLGPALDRAVAEVAPALAARAVTLRRAGSADARCAGDADHLAFALRNVLDGVVREAAPHGDVVVDAAANGIVRIAFTTGNGASTRLRAVTAQPGALPLAFTLAGSALSRCGGSLAVDDDARGHTAITVQLPAAEQA